MRLSTLWPSAWLVLAGLLLGGCGSSSRRPDALWRNVEVEAPSDRMVWQLTLLSLQNLGYPLGARTDSGSRQVESGWKTDLQPFKGEGVRRRATVRITPIEKGRWKLEARVELDHNENLVSPLDPSRAEWKPAADDAAAAQILLTHIRSRLRPSIELSEPEDHLDRLKQLEQLEQQKQPR